MQLLQMKRSFRYCTYIYQNIESVNSNVSKVVFVSVFRKKLLSEIRKSIIFYCISDVFHEFYQKTQIMPGSKP